LEEQHGNIGV